MLRIENIRLGHVYLCGDIDKDGSRMLRRWLRGLIRDGEVTLHMNDVRVISSEGVTTLLACSRFYKKYGAHLRVAEMRPLTKRLFRITGLLDVFGEG